MLSRYRSVSVVAAPEAYNNPVQRFEEAAEHRRWLLATRAGDVGLGALRTALRLWDGPLAGIAHQEGQFVALEEGPAGEDAALPPEGLAQALSLDLELLLGLAELTSDVVIDSEGESAVVPIILEPRLDAAGATQSAVSSAAATAIAAQPSTVQPSNYTEPQLSESAVLTAPGSGPVESGSGGGAGGGDGGWWSLAEAVATPLTWEEVAASLGVASELAAEMKPPTRFETKEAFLSHMLEQHVSILLEGRADWLAEAEAKAMAAAMVEAAPDDPWVTRSTPAAAAAAAAAGAAAAAAAAGAATTAAGDEDLEQRQRRAVSEAAALAAAVRQLSGAVVFPAALEVTLWSNALGWNPVLLMWVGRSRRSGAILGLLTTMIWT
ncbi:hypothetical protein PLESTF_000203900 [Pleodorina starrii]|nr:hypothetical protein PLESTF_000203900 [Pleodorina starrii]